MVATSRFVLILVKTDREGEVEDGPIFVIEPKSKLLQITDAFTFVGEVSDMVFDIGLAPAAATDNLYLFNA